MSEIQTMIRMIVIIQNLRESLEYWLPDETMIPKGQDEAWHKASEALKNAEEIR